MRRRLLLFLVSILCCSVALNLYSLSLLDTQLGSFQSWPIFVKTTSNLTFSACLLTYDDNHHLIEWLAFHYQTLPLRRLVLAVDPRSRTSPRPILDRWKNLIHITEWTDSDFFPIHYRRSILKKRQTNATSDVLVMLHRYRQRFFYLRCMRHLQLEAANQTAVRAPPNQPNWVGLIDVDEFLFPNRDWEYAGMLPAKKENSTTTVASIVNMLVSSSHFSGPCIALPRLLIGTKRDDETDMMPQKPLDRQVQQIFSNFADLDEPLEFLTMTWNWREDLDSTKSNKGGKALVQLSDVPSTSLGFHEVDVHRPVKDLCSTENMWIKIQNSPLVLHHYIGSKEQYTFRSDPRQGKRSVEEYQRYEKVNASRVDSWDTRIWLLNFVQAMGMPKASELLRGAGQLENVGSPPLDDEASYDKLLKDVYPKGLPTIISNSSISAIQLTPLRNFPKRIEGIY